MVADFVHHGSWHFLLSWFVWFPSLRSWIPYLPGTNDNAIDLLVWNHNVSGSLSLKDAYNFKETLLLESSWRKIIWCNEIPPNKAMLVWIILHEKIPPDVVLKNRGISLAYVCCLCNSIE